MKLWHLIVGAVFLWFIFGTDSGSSTSKTNNSGGSTYPRYYSTPKSDTEEFTEEDDEYDCTVFNTSTGNGPYTLYCEKDGGTITINFPNGGFIVVDEDGFHPRTGHQWDIDLH